MGFRHLGVLAIALLACSSKVSSSAPDASAGPAFDARPAADAAPVADATPPDATPVTEGEIRALVQDHENLPVEGVTVSVLGADPVNEAVTNASGEYSLILELGETVTLVATKTDYMTGHLVYTMSDEPPILPSFYEGMDLFSVPMTVVDALFTESNSGPRDATKGVVSVYFVGITEPSAGGERVQISSAAEFTGVFNSLDELIAGDITLAAGRPEVIFFDVGVGASTITLTDSAGYNCVLREPVTTYAVVASTWSLVRADCTAVQ